MTENTKPAPADDEIDLIALAKTFWSGRRIVIRSILICGVLGLLIAIFTAKEYVATTIMVPSGSDATSKLGSLGGLAAMAGINIGNAFNIGYAYDVAPSALSQYSKNTHEIIVGFLIGNKYDDSCPRQNW